MTERILKPRAADTARVKPFTWAWQDRLVCDYLNLLVGDEGIGKGTLLAWVIARLTRGDLPGDLRGKPTTVLWIGDEDGFDNVVTPRLVAANADLDRVLELPIDDAGPIDVRQDSAALRNLLAAHRDGDLYSGAIGVIVFDQLLDNLGLGVDDWRSKQVREAIGPLRRVAAEFGLCVLAALHTNKARGGSFRQTVAGTQAFNALSRSSLLIAEHPEDTDRRVLLRGKGNYSRRPPSLEFTIASHHVELNGYRLPVGVVAGLAECDVTIDQVLGTPATALTKADTGRRLITETLNDGDWHKAAEVLELLAEAGIADREARRLATDLGVERKKSEGFPAYALWRLARGGTPVYLSSRSSHSENPGGPATPATPVDRRMNGNYAGLSGQAETASLRETPLMVVPATTATADTNPTDAGTTDEETAEAERLIARYGNEAA